MESEDFLNLATRAKRVLLFVVLAVVVGLLFFWREVAMVGLRCFWREVVVVRLGVFGIEVDLVVVWAEANRPWREEVVVVGWGVLGSEVGLAAVANRPWRRRQTEEDMMVLLSLATRKMKRGGV